MSNNCPLFHDEELRDIVNQASKKSALAKQVIQDSIHYNQAIHRDQAHLLESNHLLWQKEQPEFQPFQHRVLERIESDLQAAKQLNRHLEPIPVSDKTSVTWSLKTNKMENILEHAKDMVADEKVFATLVQGHFPEAFSQSPNFPVILGDCQTPFGTSQVTYLSAALIEIHLTLLGSNAKVQDIFSDTHWIENAALLHLTHLDYSVGKEAIAEFTNSSFYFSDNTTENGFAFVHSGYAFGGQRGEYRYENEKVYGPEDCSSWIAKIVGSDVAFSTIDQLFAYRLEHEPQGHIDANWITSEVGKEMQTLFTPIKVEAPADIQPGYVMAFRNFNSENHLDSSGTSGHTALVLGMLEDDRVLTLNYARDMPKMEGYGLKAFDWQSSAKKDVMFFKVNEPISMNDVLTHETLDIFNEKPTYQPALTQHVFDENTIYHPTAQNVTMPLEQHEVVV
jgi:hypothetical protein